jgi:hypothetical protein
MKILIFLSLSMLMSFETMACSCAPAPIPMIEFQESNSVFAGTVVARTEELSPWGSTHHRATLSLIQKWKGLGDWHKKMDVVTADQSAACGFDFEVGKSYLVYAYLNNEGQLMTSLCNRTKSLDYAEEDYNFLNTLPLPIDTNI